MRPETTAAQLDARLSSSAVSRVRAARLLLIKVGLPADLAECVVRELAALTIQQAYRWWIRDRYCRMSCHWVEIERRVMALAGIDALNTLRRIPRVRREWCYEPNSWLFMLRDPVNGSHTLELILNECASGMWY